MERQRRQGPRYLDQFEVPGGGCLALCTAIVNQAIIDFNDAPTGSVNSKSAKRFLREWNLIK